MVFESYNKIFEAIASAVNEFEQKGESVNTVDVISSLGQIVNVVLSSQDEFVDRNYSDDINKQSQLFRQVSEKGNWINNIMVDNDIRSQRSGFTK